MSFAVQFLGKIISLYECTELDEESGREIQSMLPGAGDWKEKRLEELFREVSQMSFPDIAKSAGAAGDGDFLKIRYMGRDITLSRSGFEDKLDIWDKLLILMYLKNRGRGSPSGKWSAFRDLKDGLIRAESFHGACEIPLAKMIENDTQRLLSRLSAIGAEKAAGFSADYSFVLHPLPGIPFLVLLWCGDEEFGADCKVLTDSAATDFLDVEALLYLGMAMVRAMK